VADRSFVARLRASGGPSHDLLVLLDQHRVMTTSQLARATGTPERTVRFRLERLREARLVECVRPGRECGSAPRHWWLRPAGARLVAGTAVAEGRPSGMFVAHAAAISEVWLALTEHGPGGGIGAVREWLTDRAGWQEWDGLGSWPHRYRLTPDAVSRISLDGCGSVVVFVEVDLASMTQTLLKQKVARYLAYATDRAWRDTFPHCPPLLLLTTTATRAATFVRAAGQVIARQGRGVGADDPAEALVVAACGLVRDPARAIVEPCWMLPEAAAAELTLTELLAERHEAQTVSEAWHLHHNTVIRRREDLDELRDLCSFTGLADWLGNAHAAEALRALIGTDPSVFLDAQPTLAREVIDWWTTRRKVGRFSARDLARPFVAVLEARHRLLWVQQARQLLAADEHLTAAHPGLCRLAATLAGHNLASEEEITMLDARPVHTRRDLQHHAFGDYLSRRAAAVNAQWQGLPRRVRRHTSRDELATTYDDQHLAVCGTCELAYPQPEETGAAFHERCPHCDTFLLDWPDRAQAVPLAQRLDAIRDRLHHTTTGTPGTDDAGRPAA
jgi:DNA-binding transcriptional ArsR family regulator